MDGLLTAQLARASSTYLKITNLQKFNYNINTNPIFNSE